MQEWVEYILKRGQNQNLFSYLIIIVNCEENMKCKRILFVI